MNPDMDKIMRIMLSLVADQDDAEIEYELEKTA